MRKLIYFFVLMLCIGLVSSLAPPLIKEVYTPEPVVYVIFDDPTNITVDSYALARGFVDVFEQSNASNASKNASKTNLVALSPPNRTDNTFVFTPIDTLGKGNYTFKISAEDAFGNSGTFMSKFTIIELPFNISVVSPANEVANSSTFTIVIDTFTNSTCRFKETDASFDNSYTMVDNGRLHTRDAQSLPKENVGYPFYFKCKNDYGDIAAKMFLISYDTTPPIINSLTAPDTWNNKVVEPARIATLQAITDEDTVCEYSKGNSSFVRFAGNFSKNNTQKFTGLDDFTTHKFKVRCTNKAGLRSQEKSIDIEVNTGLGLGIDVKSPQPFMSSLTVPFIISTSKTASCSLASSGNNFSIPLSSSNGVSHTYTEYVAGGGNYTYKVACSYLKVTVNSSGYDLMIADIKFVVDITEPIINNVTDEGRTASLTSLKAVVDAADPESGIKAYYFAVDEDGSTDYSVKGWTMSSSNTLSATGLNLTNGGKYFFAVIVSNGAGMNSSPAYSAGVVVDTSYTGLSNITVPVNVSRVGCTLDSDMDGYGLNCVNGFDCDDKNSSVNNRNCGNGCIQDSDGDGFGTGCDSGRDCNDTDNYVSYPCSDKCRIDMDGDGYGPGCLNGPDCDDYGSAVIGSCDSGTGCTNDADCDGMDDEWEITNGLNPNVDDSAGDLNSNGISNLDEYRANSDPLGSGQSSTVQKPQPVIRNETSKTSENKGIDWMLIAIIVVIVLLVGIGGYVGYSYLAPKKPSRQQQFAAQQQREAARTAQTSGGYGAPILRGGAPGMTLAQRREEAARKAKTLRREHISKERSSFFDVFAPSKGSGVKEEIPVMKKEPVEISELGRRILRKAHEPIVRKREETSEFKGLSNLLEKKDVFDRLDALKKSERDVFEKIKGLNERHFERLDSMLKEKGMSEQDAFESLTKVGRKGSHDEFTDKLDRIINKRKR